MRHAMLASAIAFTLTAIPASKAQVSIDIFQITCEQLAKADEPILIGLWLSGYYHAKRNSTVLDLKQFKANAETLVQQCAQNPSATVMQAFETAAPR